MFTKLLLVTLFAMPLSAQTFFKVASEGASQAASPVVTLAAGMTYRFGSGTKFCDPVTVKAATPMTVWYASITCTVNGVPTSDPDQGVNKELDVAEQASAGTIAVKTGTVASSVTVPALPAPTVVSTQTCTATITLQTMSDGTTNIIGPFSCKP